MSLAALGLGLGRGEERINVSPQRARRHLGLLVSLSLATIAGLSGCAIPIPGICGDDRCELLAGYSAASPDRSRRLVPGLDLRRGGAFQGVTMGWSDYRVVRATRPGDGARKDESDRSPTVLGFPAYVSWRSEDGLVHQLGIMIRRDPIEGDAFVHSIRGGLSALAGDHGSGLELGISSTTHLHVPLDQDGIYWIDYRSREFGTSTVRFDGPEPSGASDQDSKETNE